MRQRGADDLLGLLASVPRIPTDVNRFSSNPLFGQPGLYPAGTPMVPASGPVPSEEQIRADLGAVLSAADRTDAAVRFDDRQLAAAVPDATLRAALVVLDVTVAPGAATVGPDHPVAALRWGIPSSPGRVVGPPGADDGGPTADRVVNERYRSEHFAVIAPSLAHDLLWTGPGADRYPECFLHAVLAAVHLQLLALQPALASAPTELTRRQNSLAISLCHSRQPGSARITLRAPDGPGTVPGGNPGMQTPDFWSIPFVGGPPVADAVPDVLTRPLTAVLAAFAGPLVSRPVPLAYDDALIEWFDRRHDRRWLSAGSQLVATAALGLAPVDVEQARALVRAGST